MTFDDLGSASKYTNTIENSRTQRVESSSIVIHTSSKLDR